MELEKAIARREVLYKRANELDDWVQLQGSYNGDFADHPLKMPKSANFLRGMKKLVEEAWDEYCEIDDRIKEVTKGLVVPDVKKEDD